jgi:hypothetical protein
MKHTPSNPKCQNSGLPCKWVRTLAGRSRVAHAFFRHVHWLQILDDHHFMWLEEATKEGKVAIEKRLKKQLALAATNHLAVDGAIHSVLVAFAEPSHGLMMLGVCIAVIKLTTNGHQ